MFMEPNEKNEAKKVIDEIDKITGTDKTEELLHANLAEAQKQKVQNDQIIVFLKDLALSQTVSKESILVLIEIAKQLQVKFPPYFDVKLLNQKLPEEIKITNLDAIKFPDSLKIEHSEWISTLLTELTKGISLTIQKQLQDVNITGPTDPRKAVAVRLSDGKSFYTALNQIVQAGSISASELQQITELLQQIEENTDELELSAENVNLNTDELEEKIQTLIDTTAIISNPGSVDAFSRFRISQPVSLFDSQSQYNNSPLWWYEKLTGAGTSVHLPNESTVRIDVTTASGDSVIRQSKRYFHYQPGKSQLIAMTFVLNSPKINLRQRVGYFDSSNGIFLEVYHLVSSIVLRTNTSGSPVDTAVPQSSWNVDKLDGTGISGITLDLTKAQILFIDFQWLGTGRVRAGFNINGIIYYAHEFLNANNLMSVYMTTGNLPVRYEIENTGVTSSSSSLKSICSTVISEGGIDLDRVYQFSAQNPIAGASIGATRQSVLSIRPKTTFNGITVRSIITFLDVNMFATGNIIWQIVYNPTLTGAIWTSPDSQSTTEYSDSNVTITDGIILYTGFVAASAVAATSAFAAGGGKATNLPLTLNIDGVSPIALSIVGRNVSGGAVTTNCALNWSEQY